MKTTIKPLVPTTRPSTSKYVPPVETTVPTALECEDSMDILFLIDVAGISKINLDILKGFLINVSRDVPLEGDGKKVNCLRSYQSVVCFCKFTIVYRDIVSDSVNYHNNLHSVDAVAS